MDIEVSANELKKGEYSSHKKLKENCVLVEAKHVVELQPASIVAADEVPSLEPVTPDSNRESGDLPLDFTSPLTLVSSSLDVVIDFDSHKNVELCASIDDSPRTPKEGVFDPFAPGPDKLMLAPQCNKYLQESQGNVARRLNLDPFVKCAGNESRVSDKVSISDLDEVMLLEKVYAALLEEIVSAQTGEVLVAPLDLVSDSFKTPSSSARLSGVAETCPAAPMKPTRKLRNIDPVLCRKLQF